jgi:hypothetical protein
VITEESRSLLPLESRRAGGRLILKKNGDFVSEGIPGELLYSTPGAQNAAPASGTGTWRLGEVDGDDAIFLTFHAIVGPTEYEAPSETQLLVDKDWHETVLYFFLGDPDEGERVDFKKVR